MTFLAGVIVGGGLMALFAIKVVTEAREDGRQQGHDEAWIVRKAALRMEGTRFPRNGGSAA